MNRQQFIIIALFTAAETYFSMKLDDCRYIMAAFEPFCSLEIFELLFRWAK